MKNDKYYDTSDDAFKKASACIVVHRPHGIENQHQTKYFIQKEMSSMPEKYKI